MALLIVGFGFTTWLTAIKARELRKWPKVQQELTEEIRKLNGGKPVPKEIKLMNTKNAIGPYTKSEWVLLGGFVVTSAGAIITSIFNVFGA